MKYNIKEIQINKPCHENWENMTNVSGGKFCVSCQKNVVDFSKMSNQAILDHLSANNSGCGKFADFQLESFNQYLSDNNRPPSFFKRLGFAAIFMGLFSSININVKAQPPVQQGLTFIKNKVNNNAPNYTISGFVRYNNGRVSGATVKVRGTNIFTTTNGIGYFKLTVPASVDTLIIDCKEYEQALIPVDANKKTAYDITLSKPQIKLMATKIPRYDPKNTNGLVGRLPGFFGDYSVTAYDKKKDMTWFNIWFK